MPRAAAAYLRGPPSAPACGRHEGRAADSESCTHSTADGESAAQLPAAQTAQRAPVGVFGSCTAARCRQVDVGRGPLLRRDRVWWRGTQLR